jgi:hypothetical protein
MKNFIYGLKSLFIKPTKKKFTFILIPLFVMAFLLFNKNFQIEHPVITFLGFWLAIPLYIWTLGSVYKDKNGDTNKSVGYENHNQTYNFDQEDINPVSHIERKTTVTNTTVTTETIYLKKGSNYIE